MVVGDVLVITVSHQTLSCGVAEVLDLVHLELLHLELVELPFLI